MSLLKAIEAINTRGETPNLELIAYELQEMGFSRSLPCYLYETDILYQNLITIFINFSRKKTYNYR